MDSLYVYAYYMAAGVSLALITLFAFLKQQRSELAALKTLVTLVIGITYLVGMTRQQGVDYGNYLYAFHMDQSLIPDPGFQALMVLVNRLDLPFQALMLLIAAVTLYSLRRAARYFAVSFALLLTLYFLHLAVVRDFAQLRIGLAVGIAILGVTSSGKVKRGGFYFLAGSVHLTSLAFILAYEFCKWAAELGSRTKQATMMVGAVASIFVLSTSVQYLSFIDPRISLYLAWEEEGYGLPVGQFLILFFQLAVLALAYQTRRSWKRDARMRTLVFLQILGVTAFVAFINVAIFAFRISSAMLSLYPVLLIAALAYLRLRVDGRSVSRIAAASIFLLVGLVLISRPGNVEILGAIRFAS